MRKQERAPGHAARVIKMNKLKHLLSFLFFFVFSMILFSVTAFAYIDPSAMTYIIQIIAGVVIAAGAAFGFYWRKIKRAFSKRKGEDAYSADYDLDDDDDGYDDYEIDDGGEYESNDAPAAAAQAAYRTAVPTPDAGFAAPSSSAYTESTRPIADIYDDIKIPEAPSDKYDEVGGESALLRENRELRRLLAEEREKVEILKKSLHICTQPTKK